MQQITRHPFALALGIVLMHHSAHAQLILLPMNMPLWHAQMLLLQAPPHALKRTKKYTPPYCEETPPVTDPLIADALELLSAMSGDERYALLCRILQGIDAHRQTE